MKKTQIVQFQDDRAVRRRLAKIGRGKVDEGGKRRLGRLRLLEEQDRRIEPRPEEDLPRFLEQIDGTGEAESAYVKSASKTRISSVVGRLRGTAD